MGRKFKKFLDELYQHIFKANLTIFEGTGNFPLAYNEKNNYSTIASAINTLTPYHMSESSIDCRDYKLGNTKKKRRVVDFWCKGKKKDFELWIEAKHIEFYFNKDKWSIYLSYKESVRKAYRQVLDIHTMDKQDGIQSHKLVLFNTLMCWTSAKYERYSKDKNIYQKLEQAPKDLAKEIKALCDECSDKTNEGLLLGVLDLREYIKKGKDVLHSFNPHNDYVAPYVILAGIVIAPPKS